MNETTSYILAGIMLVALGYIFGMRRRFVTILEEVASTLLKALSHYRQDNLERAQHAFKGWSKKKMAQPWSGNGESAQEVLDGYQDHADRVSRARKFVEGLQR